MIEEVHISTTIAIDLGQNISTQSFYNAIQAKIDEHPELVITGVSMDIILLNCKTSGVIDPPHDIREAVSRLYDYCVKSIFKPIWDLLNRLLNALGGNSGIEPKLPVLNLTITDLFATDLYDKIKAQVTNLYYNAKEDLQTLLDRLKISNLFQDLITIEHKIESIVKAIMVSLWDFVLNAIARLIDLIGTACLVWDLANPNKPFSLSAIWEGAKTAVIKFVLEFFTIPPSINEIYNKIIKFMQDLYGKPNVTFKEIMDRIGEFKLPIFGKPFDWDLPFKGKNSPNLGFADLIIDIKNWLNNFLLKVCQRFIAAIVRILEFFQVPHSWLTFNVPILLCGVKRDLDLNKPPLTYADIPP
jgi:hypothetical protein